MFITSILQSSLDLGLQLTGNLQLLDIRVTTDVLATDEHVRDSLLASELVQSFLDLGTILRGVQLQNVGLLSEVGNSALGSRAVRAVSL